MATPRVLVSLIAVSALLAGCGADKNGDKSPPSGDTATTTTAKTSTTKTTTSTTPKKTSTKGKKSAKPATAADVRKNGKVTENDRKMMTYAIQRTQIECAQRRKAKEPVGRPSRVFRDQVKLLIAEFKDTPNTEFRLTKSKRVTTPRRALAGLGQKLAQKAPKGCGANSQSGGGTAIVSLQIRRALAGK